VFRLFASSLGLLLVAAAPSAQTCTYHVDGGAGQDANDGRTESTAWATIQRAADVLQPGQTVCIRAGVYRETVRPPRGGQPGARITFRAAPGDDGRVVISGADPLTGWVADGNDWRWDWSPGSDWDVQADGSFGLIRDPNHGDALTIRRELLVGQSGESVTGSSPEDLWDGHLLRPVASRAELATALPDPELGLYGAFWVDTTSTGGAKALYARFHDGRSPDSASPLFAVRERAFWPGASDMACGDAEQPGYFFLKGLLFRHTANLQQRGAVCLGHEGSIMEDSAVEFVNGKGIELGASPFEAARNHFLRRIQSAYNGQLGIGGVCHDCTIVDSRVAYNNRKGYRVRWEAGGIKISWSERFVVRRVLAEHNRGPGIWFDEGNTDAVIEGNQSLDNHDVGLFLELFTLRSLVQHNLVARTKRIFSDDMSGTGILSQVAQENAFYWNTVVANDGNGVYVRFDERINQDPSNPDYSWPAPWNGLRNDFYNNVIAGNALTDEGLYDDEAHEIQMQGLTRASVRTNRFGGNRIMSHDGDPDGLQYSFVTFWQQPEELYEPTQDLSTFRSSMAIPQPDAQALLPYKGASYGALADLSTPLPDYGTAVDVPAELPCSGPACVVRCSDGIGANRDALTGDFLADPETACIGTPVSRQPDTSQVAMSFTVGPNPARGIVRVASDREARIEVFDVVGRRVARAEGREVEFDTSSWAPGIYLIRWDDGASVHTRTVAVAR